ncbi:hypothetical protein Pla111_26960 [Botrimarina hoheduenensis]|uniref:Uncharacterized protein n=2 Tax=Botrimarina hoheduenensis TaxID=2528000 RepID=A0A5C5VXT4_9BACT|nr:hypothetical protein Pla111_26960 [Botrimarina hoheduenensis]
MRPLQKSLTIAALGLGFCLMACEAVEAGPQWRLRRWSTRAPIDPSIRTSVSFRAPTQRWPATTRHFYSGGPRVRVVVR